MCQRSDCMLCVSLYPVHRPPLFSCCFSILWPFSSSVRVHLATNRKGLAYPFFFKKEKKEKEIKVFSSSSFLPLPTHQSTWQWVDEKSRASKVVKEKKKIKENRIFVVSFHGGENGMEWRTRKFAYSHQEKTAETHTIYNITSYHIPLWSEWEKNKINWIGKRENFFFLQIIPGAQYKYVLKSFFSFLLLGVYIEFFYYIQQPHWLVELGNSIFV